MRTIKIFYSNMHRILSFVIAVMVFFAAFITLNMYKVMAEDGAYVVDGKIYGFNKNTNYEFTTADTSSFASESEDTIGTFSVAGGVDSITEILGIPYYIVDGTALTITYSYVDQMHPGEGEWEISKDNGKKVDSISLDSNINNGAFILQTSKDGNKWSTVYTETNVFEDVPTRTDPIYTTTDIELKNGCYYRFIVAYEKKIKTGSTEVVGINLGDRYDYKKFTEVYLFCACDKNSAERNADTDMLKYSFSDRVKVKNDTGYSEELEIDKDDPHYGWDLGNFFIKGYTAQTTDQNGKLVFLSNPGDELTLEFNLKEDIDALNNDANLSIADDEKGYDKQFEVDLTDMGRGTLLVQYIDYENVSHSVALYKDYLSGVISAGSDTTVVLKEEGDYEVALDYKIKKKNILGTDIFPSYFSYKIAFSFSIRNGNCMVYPFDMTTGSELTNSSYTENGFYIDLARSKYLDINVKKEVLNDNGSGLIEDTRFNKPAKAGDKYIDEGIYTISAFNRYTNQRTEKTIYVGTNNILRAHVVNGFSVEELNDMVIRGAVIDDNGNIDFTSMDMEETVASMAESSKETTEESVSEIITAEKTEDSNKGISPVIFIIVGAAVVLIIVLIIVVSANNKKKADNTDEK